MDISNKEWLEERICEAIRNKTSQNELMRHLQVTLAMSAGDAEAMIDRCRAKVQKKE